MLLAVILVGTAAMLGMAAYVTTVAVGAARVQHQRDTLQCVYAAESGIELAMARANRGVIADGPIAGSVGTALFTARAVQTDGKLTITSDGIQQRPGRAQLVRRIEVVCRRSNGTYQISRWRTLPPPEPEAIEPAPIGPQEENR